MISLPFSGATRLQASKNSPLVVPRIQFLAWLESIERTGLVEQLAVQHEERMETVRQAADLKHTRKVLVASAGSTADELRNTRFGDLPPGVELTAKSLHIDFYGTEDFLQKFGAVVFALQNDRKGEISRFIEDGCND